MMFKNYLKPLLKKLLDKTKDSYLPFLVFISVCGGIIWFFFATFISSIIGNITFNLFFSSYLLYIL